MKPRVSVIVPIYNVEKYLRQALDSLLAQTLHELEIILIDDGSKDGCLVIIDEYADADGRIMAIHKPNGGYGSACNVGLARASGEYVAIFEPDYFLESNAYETLYNAAKLHNVDVVKSDFFTYVDVPNKVPRDDKNNWFSRHEANPWSLPDGAFTIYQHPVFFFFHPSIWSCIYRRDFIEKNKIRMEEAPGAGWTDNLFQVQTLCLAKSMVYVDAMLYHWRLLCEDQSANLNDYRIPFRITKNIHEWLLENKITDKDIFACLFKRDLAYMWKVMNIAKYSQLSKIENLIDIWADGVDIEWLGSSKYINEHDLKFFVWIKNFRKSYFSHIYFMKCRKFLNWLRKLKNQWRKLFSLHRVYKGWW